MQIVLTIFILAFGLIIGSFLNAVIYRLKYGGSIVFDRSKCPHCKHVLNFLDLVPIFSFIFLRGKCRYCHKQISWQYPAVELITAILFLLIFNFQPASPTGGFLIFNQFLILNFQNILEFCYLLFVICCLVVIFVYDLQHQLILDKVLLFVGAISILFNIVLFSFNRNFLNFWQLFFGLAIGGGFFLLMYLISHGKWIGEGDIKFGFLMGLWLSFPKILVAMFCAFVIGGIAAVVLLFSGRKGMKSQVPFGPFLALGTLIALLWGKQILDWYLKWLGF